LTKNVEAKGESVDTIEWRDFEKVDLRVGEVVAAEIFKEARKPAYILHVDFGKDLGVRKSSVQVTEVYSAEELVGRRVVGVVNFPRKQIGPLMSECLVTGFHDSEGRVVLCVPDKDVPLGAKLC
jgi:tRNA-binding protein